MLAVIAGPDWRDGGVVPVPVRSSASVDLSGARVAVVGGAGIAHPEVTDAVERAAAVFEAAGATRVAWIDSWLDDGLDVTERYWDRTGLTGAEAARQLWDWDRYRRRYLQAAEHVDLVLSPAAKEAAPVDREIGREDFLFTLPASLTGSPAVVVPWGRDDAGMPLSVQIVGRPWEDHRVLAAARVLEGACTASCPGCGCWTSASGGPVRTPRSCSPRWAPRSSRSSRPAATRCGCTSSCSPASTPTSAASSWT